jgi:hypothetical protein
MKRAGLPILLLALGPLAAMALAGDNETWKTKAPAKWTLEDAQQVLARSPWVQSRALLVTFGGGSVPERYEVRIRSALPIRMALAHSILEQPGLHLRSAKPPDHKALREKADSLGVPNQLLISVRCQDPRMNDALDRQSLRTFKKHAFIELEGNGQRVYPIGYDAPWQNDLGVAVFHFPRPSPEEVGRRITFVARFGVPGVVTLKVDFDVKDLQWHGHEEY